MNKKITVRSGKYLKIICVLLLATFSFPGRPSISSHTGEEDSATKVRIRQVLIKFLKPSDLDLSKAELKKKLLSIASRTGAFDAEIDAHHLWPVRGAERQWVFIALNSSEKLNLFVPYKGYWIGVVGDHVLVTPLPDDPDNLTGPPVGEWRMNGRYIIGIGVNLAMHSPTWADGSILVYQLGSQGLVSIFAESIGGVDVHFASASSYDVVAEDTEELCKIIDTNKIGATEMVRWRFADGEYREISKIPIFPEVLAFDRLMQSVDSHRPATFSKMVPQRSLRSWLAKEIRRCIYNGITHIDFIEGTNRLGLTKQGASDLESHFTLAFHEGKSGWKVTQIMKR